MRRICPVNEDWYFTKNAVDIKHVITEDVIDHADKVNLPHTWNAADGMDGGNDYYRGKCWYFRNLKMIDIEKMFDETDIRKNSMRIYMEIPAAAFTSEVYINGYMAVKHDGGYSTFRVDITDYLDDINTVAILCDNSANDRVYPQKADFTFYGGLYRGVYLICVPEVHFALDTDGSRGIEVTTAITKSESGNSADITVKLWTVAEAQEVMLILDNKIRKSKVENGFSCTVFHMDDVHLWNGIDDPFLYTVTARMTKSGSGSEKNGDFDGDEISERFGCRSFYIDPNKGFILNGKSYPLRGVSRHQDRYGYGNALTSSFIREDLDLILEIGANTVRLAHYQHSQEFYDLCDKTGLIVWAEIPYITVHMHNGIENSLSQMRELVMQNINHPSIICWCISNEITAGSNVDDELINHHREMNELCHRLDHTRFTVMANVFMLETDSPMLNISDVNSYNLYYGWYLGKLEQNEHFFDDFHAAYPNRIIGLSEYGAECNVKFQTPEPTCGDYSEQYQCLYHEHMVRMIEERPYLWSTYVWNMFDFGSDGKDEGGRHGLNQKGLVTSDRKIKKDVFYLYKAFWGSEAFIHICGRRYVHRIEDITEIKVYSNQQKVTLYVDGKMAAEQSGKAIFIFNVPISGKHRITAQTGNLQDVINIQKVIEADPDYEFVACKVTNWLDELTYDNMSFSVKDTLEDIMQNTEAGEIVNKLLENAVKKRGEVAGAAKDNIKLKKMMSSEPLMDIIIKAGEAVSKEQIQVLNAALQKIKKNL